MVDILKNPYNSLFYMIFGVQVSKSSLQQANRRSNKINSDENSISI